MAKRVNRQQVESVLKNGTPADMYALIPKHARKRFETFAKCFGISKSDIARLRKQHDYDNEKTKRGEA